MVINVKFHDSYLIDSCNRLLNAIVTRFPIEVNLSVYTRKTWFSVQVDDKAPFRVKGGTTLTAIFSCAFCNEKPGFSWLCATKIPADLRASSSGIPFIGHWVACRKKRIESPRSSWLPL